MIVFFLLLSLFFPKSVLGVYEEYYFYKNCQTRELLQLGKEIQQRFTIDKDFGAIEVYFDRERLGNGDLEFVLKNKDGRVLYRNIYPLEKIINGYFFPFGFDRIRVNTPKDFTFSIKLLKNPNNVKIYVCRDSKWNLSFKISGERGVFESLKFWLIYNIKQDPLFFGFYFFLLFGIVLMYKKF